MTKPQFHNLAVAVKGVCGYVMHPFHNKEHPVSVLFSREFFGLVMTLVGCMIYSRNLEFSLFNTIIAVLLTLGGMAVTLKTSRKWLLAVHIAAFVSALMLPVMPKAFQNLFSVIYTLALIPFVLNILRLLIRKMVGIEDSKDESSDSSSDKM